jgi:hypothetical protein
MKPESLEFDLAKRVLLSLPIKQKREESFQMVRPDATLPTLLIALLSVCCCHK